MADYLDNDLKEDETVILLKDSPVDSLDTPILIDNGHDNSNTTQCLCGQKGFGRNATSDNQSNKAKNQLIAATSICFIFMIAELIGGYLAGSLAIMTDAAHLLSDCISFIVALIAIWLSKKPADNKMTFGYKRAEVFGAIISVVGIWVLTAVLCYLAIERLSDGNFDIEANTMIIVSSFGVGINIIMGIVLHGSCSLLAHNHSHGSTSPNSSHNHSHNKSETIGHHNHSHSKPHSHSHLGGENCLPLPAIQNTAHLNGMGRRTSSFGSVNSYTHSRHNSFSKLINKNLDIEPSLRNSSDGLNMRGNADPLVHRMSIDGGLTRISLGNPYSRLNSVEDNNTTSLLAHRNSADSSLGSNESINDTKQNINIRAAVIHVIGDFIQSIGVFIAAIVIKIYPNAKIADPICTFVFSIIVVFTTVQIMRDSIRVLLDSVPENIVLSKLEMELSCIQGVRSIHHLNVWSLSLDWNIMSVHLIVEPMCDTEEVLQAATMIARKGFDIKHSTIQIEKQNSILGDLKISELNDVSETMINFGTTDSIVL